MKRVFLHAVSTLIVTLYWLWVQKLDISTGLDWMNPSGIQVQNQTILVQFPLEYDIKLEWLIDFHFIYWFCTIYQWYSIRTRIKMMIYLILMFYWNVSICFFFVGVGVGIYSSNSSLSLVSNSFLWKTYRSFNWTSSAYRYHLSTKYFTKTN